MTQLINFSLLKKDREFCLLYLGQFISLCGTMISWVALPYQIYQLTHSTAQVGLLSLVQLGPLLITSLLGGVFADRYNRRALLLYSELFLALGCILLMLNALNPHPRLVPIFLISSIMSAINGIHRPALESISQQLVKPEDYKTLGSLGSFKYSFTMIVGPAIGGFIIASTSLAFTYFIDVLTFVISLISLGLMKKIPKPIVQEHPPLFTSLKQGLTFALSRQELMGSYWVDFIAMLFAMPNALFPAIAQSLGGATTLGLLYAAPAVGALMISFFSAWTANVKQDGKAIALAAAFWGLSIIGFGLASSIWLALFFLGLSGAFDAISGIFRSSLWNNSIPHEYRGRLAGIEILSYMSGPKLGDARAGLVATYLGIPASILSGGLLCIFGVLACSLLMPKFWHYKS